ncbi:hypothetical protein PPERSA_07893 [Pseudocohnilembus persalinus]|uniref:40S ribosomal protein S4 n=1 Tax=Pseudocohnilembus persalinus TaxID=266149 RepID=A0A0V0QC84_PSEPJ|nr:hypothetical protein PPERSA_07893 [Pseudocohnilembus persalinus]|eukprot:KRW99816.1 hypothetical protein PPERSA_07893 [Pseudocohnilembus persalinus]
MARGPKHHQKRIAAPKSWMLGKLGGVYAVRPSQGPHKLRQSIPLSVVLRNKLKYALKGRDVTQILRDREANIRVDGVIRRDKGFPLGVMDVITIEKTNESYRILYDVKGRFILRSLKKDEAQIKLLKVTQKAIGPNKVPYIVTNDARTFRFPNPAIQINDTLKYNLSTGKIEDFVKLEIGNLVYTTAGNNVGRVGTITNLERHPGSFDIVHIKDSNGHQFATRQGNVFVIGKGKKSWITLAKDEGLYLTALESKRAQDQGLGRHI